MTTATTAGAAAPTKKKAPSKPKAPILLAERSLDKQIQAINASPLDARVKTQVVDWLAGIKRTLQLLEQVVDVDNPPAGTSVHGQLIALGRSQRTLAQVLAGVVGDTSEDEDEDADSAPLGDPAAAAAALQAASKRTPASIGV